MTEEELFQSDFDAAAELASQLREKLRALLFPEMIEGATALQAASFASAPLQKAKEAAALAIAYRDQIEEIEILKARTRLGDYRILVPIRGA
ncbi:MAG: hypothetical protein AAFR11_05740 [Pseudomonadota bacterium]